MSFSSGFCLPPIVPPKFSYCASSNNLSRAPKTFPSIANFALPPPPPPPRSSSTNSESKPLLADASTPDFLPPQAAALSEAFGRRFLLGTAAALAVAFGGNLGGITSFFLGLNSDFSQNLKLDAVYPVNGFKRCIEKDFEFLYPATWVGDQRLLYRAVERAERERLPDFQPLQRKKERERSSTEPVVGFGPPGSNGELNVSVIVAPVSLDFRLEKLGGPKEAGELILNNFIASRSPNIIPTLLNAKRRDEILKGERVSYYTLEFSVKGPTFLRHNVAVYAAQNGRLLSLNAQAPEALWPGVMKQFQEMADSFRLSF